jgi:formate dehydrogenase subunit gamma
MKMVKKTTALERVVHWTLMFSFVNLTLTGFAFAYTSLNWLNLLYGGNHYASTCHKWNGVLFLAALLLTVGSYLGESLRFGPEDSEWLRKMGGYFDKNAELPPQGRMNFGQKIFYLVFVLLSGLVISVSGFMLWAGSSEVGYFLHNIAFFAMVSFMPIHVYLATAANPGVFRVMTRGTVSLDFARKHYPKWVKDEGLE